MPVLTNAQVATLQKVLAVTNNVLPRLEMLEALANINMAMKPRVQELRAQREYLASLATAALEIERQLGGAISVPPVATSAGVQYSPPPVPYAPPPPPPAPFVGMPSPPTAPKGVAVNEPGGYAPGYRQFIRRDPPMMDDEQREWLARGWRVIYEPETGWWGVHV